MRRGCKSLSVKQKSVVFVIVTVTSLFYIGWRILFTIPLNNGALTALLGLALALSEIIAVVETLSHCRGMLASKSPEKPDIPDDMYPHVDVLIATHSEDTGVLEKTLNGCGFLEYPDRSKVHIYLCDDTNRPEMRQLAQQMGVGYFGLSGNRDAKAGNLNNALSKTDSPLVMTLDADMIPTSGILLETVPYFFLPKMIKENNRWRLRTADELVTDEKVGFIQTPQSFYNADLFQYNLHAEKSVPNEQDYFFREINIGRNRTNSVVYAGSNTIISRKALEEVGGIRTNTITEDFATGLDIQAAGYASYAIDKVLAHGLAPKDFKSLIKQRQRWARGCVQVLRSKSFLFSKLPLNTKFSYMVCFLYWWTFFRRFIYIISPILFAVFGIAMVHCSLWGLLLIWLPSYLIYSFSLRAMSGNIRSTRWSNMIDTILFPYMIIPVMAETIGFSMKKFHVTPKVKESAKNSEFKYSAPYLMLIVASIIGIACCVYNFFEAHNYGVVIIFFWLCMNSYMLINAVIFSVGRIDYRSEDRYNVKVPVVLKVGELVITGETVDLSENGMAILLATPECLPYDDAFDIMLAYKNYRALVKATSMHVSQAGAHWKYSLKIIDCSEKDRKQYLQIVFDRDHTLPTTINSGLLGDTKAVLSGCSSKSVKSDRKLPRIPMNIILHTENRGKMELIDFNYEYLSVKNVPGLESSPAIRFGDEYSLHCKRMEKYSNNTAVVYRIENWKELSTDPYFRAMLFAMIQSADSVDDIDSPVEAVTYGSRYGKQPA